MFGEFWINLPVKDVSRTTDFFNKMGFPLDHEYSQGRGVKLTVGDTNTIVWLYETALFEEFAECKAIDASQAGEVLLSMYVESREAVDDIARNAFDAGGTIFSEPREVFGWLYGCGFADIDGHRWNVIYKDESKMPQT